MIAVLFQMLRLVLQTSTSNKLLAYTDRVITSRLHCSDVKLYGHVNAIDTWPQLLTYTHRVITWGSHYSDVKFYRHVNATNTWPQLLAYTDRVVTLGLHYSDVKFYGHVNANNTWPQLLTSTQSHHLGIGICMGMGNPHGSQVRVLLGYGYGSEF
jgi:hypothetical protein